MPLSDELPFESHTHVTATCTLPFAADGARVTRTLLTLRAVAPDNADLPAAGSVEVFLYPPEVPGEWKKTIATLLAQSGLGRLEVFGKGAGLRRFLKARRVDFGGWRRGLARPARSPYPHVGDAPAALPARLGSTESAWLVLFQPPEASALLPGFYQSFHSVAGNTVKVTLPDVLTRLEDDPRSQETLAQIFRCALEPRTPATATTPNTPAAMISPRRTILSSTLAVIVLWVCGLLTGLRAAETPALLTAAVFNFQTTRRQSGGQGARKWPPCWMPSFPARHPA